MATKEKNLESALKVVKESLARASVEVQLQTSAGKRYVCRYSLGTRWVEGEEVPYLKSSVTEEDE